MKKLVLFGYFHGLIGKELQYIYIYIYILGSEKLNFYNKFFVFLQGNTRMLSLLDWLSFNTLLSRISEVHCFKLYAFVLFLRIMMHYISLKYCVGLAAFMLNHMTWETNEFESFLEVEAKLNLTLEVVIIPLRNCDDFFDCGICRFFFPLLKKEKGVKSFFCVWGRGRGFRYAALDTINSCEINF